MVNQWKISYPGYKALAGVINKRISSDMVSSLKAYITRGNLFYSKGYEEKQKPRIRRF